MRATTQAPIFMASVFLLISLKVRAQKVDTIHLQVNTVLLNKENVNEVSNFGQPEHISNQDYTINAALGDIIIWKGTSTTSNYDKVQIKTIAYESGVRIFSRSTLRDMRQNPGMIKGVITRGKEGDVNKYRIGFEVLNNDGSSSGNFYIDPKIRIISTAR